MSSFSPTLRDIAAVTGYAKSTVSEALRGNPRIPVDTQEAIRKAARDLGYQTDARVSMLMAHLRQRHKSGAVSVAWLQYSTDTKPRRLLPWCSGIWEGAESRAKHLGFHLSEIILQERDYTPERVRGILLSRGIEGVVIAPPWHKAAYAEFNWTGLATIACGAEAQRAPNHFVGPNFRENMILVFENLRRLGYRRPALWFSEHNDIETRHAVAGTYLMLCQYLPARDRIPWQPRDVSFSTWVRRHRPDVVICGHNEMADMLRAEGRRVPEDTGIIHVNVCSDVTGWAGIIQNHPTIGGLAIESISSQLNHNERALPEDPCETLVTGRWVDGWTLPQR